MKVIVVTSYNEKDELVPCQDIFTDSRPACEKVIFWIRKGCLESDSTLKDFEKLEADAREQTYYGTNGEQRVWLIQDRIVLYREYEIDNNKMPPY